MWFLSSFGIQDGAFGLVDTENSLLAVIGSAIAVIFAPLGFNTWQAVASSLSGFVAKEGIVSTMGVLAGLGEVEEYAVSMHDQFAAFFPTTMVAVSFLLFNLFDSPCLAAISTTAKEVYYTYCSEKTLIRQQQRALHLRHQTCNGFLNENQSGI